MEQILYGAPVAEQLDKISKNVFQEHTNKNGKPHLTAITVGDNPASLLYVSRKQEKALELGVEFNWIKLSEKTSQDDLSELISSESKDTDGIIIQLPLPNHLNPEEAINCIPYKVDVDGLTSYNLGSLFSETYKLIPATSLAVLELLNYYKIKTEDKNIVIAGRSRLVSAPLAKILSSKSYNGNVSIIHSKTSNQKLFTKQADIFISAIGSAKMYDHSFFKEGSTIIDIGISSVDDKTYGDIDTDQIGELVSFRSPFPGGVGPITVSALFFNLSRLVSSS
jgi:methylenetetrahydrofolate dehydrogenase (NADP+)/methenyltetrahydrofolate cyclohydrolase|tara:strand:- start:152 stop:991 length:840 start_codon:yes stop_codon:yes gene_type:complete